VSRCRFLIAVQSGATLRHEKGEAQSAIGLIPPDATPLDAKARIATLIQSAAFSLRVAIRAPLVGLKMAHGLKMYLGAIRPSPDRHNVETRRLGQACWSARKPSEVDDLSP
jgi:hypothetical protein